MTTIEPTYLIDLGNQQPGIQPLLSPKRALSGRTHVKLGMKADHTFRSSTQVVGDELDTIEFERPALDPTEPNQRRDECMGAGWNGSHSSLEADSGRVKRFATNPCGLKSSKRDLRPFSKHASASLVEFYLLSWHGGRGALVRVQVEAVEVIEWRF